MSKTPASGSKGDSDLMSGTSDTKTKDQSGEEKAMEEAQEDAAEERATEGGYQ